MTTMTDASMRSPVDPGIAVVNASNADLHAELDYRNADRYAEALQRRHQGYAVKFVLDCGMDGRAPANAEPTDASLALTLGGCARSPRPIEYAAIRMHVDTYRMAQMSATDAVRDKLTELADWYESDAAPVDPNLRTLLNRRIAEELQKVAASL